MEKGDFLKDMNQFGTIRSRHEVIMTLAYMNLPTMFTPNILPIANNYLEYCKQSNSTQNIITC